MFLIQKWMKIVNKKIVHIWMILIPSSKIIHIWMIIVQFSQQRLTSSIIIQVWMIRCFHNQPILDDSIIIYGCFLYEISFIQQDVSYHQFMDVSYVRNIMYYQKVLNTYNDLFHIISRFSRDNFPRSNLALLSMFIILKNSLT